MSDPKNSGNDTHVVIIDHFYFLKFLLRFLNEFLKVLSRSENIIKNEFSDPKNLSNGTHIVIYEYFDLQPQSITTRIFKLGLQ